MKKRNRSDREAYKARFRQASHTYFSFAAALWLLARNGSSGLLRAGLLRLRQLGAFLTRWRRKLHLGIITTSAVWGLSAEAEDSRLVEAYRVHVGDFVGDSRPDVVVAYFEGGSVQILENKGEPEFDSIVIHDPDTTKNVTSVQVVDLDGDSFPDLLVTSAGSDAVTWLEGTGSSNAFNLFDLPPASAPWDAEVGDLDRDGDNDIVVAESGADRVMWYENNGSEGFVPHLVSDDVPQVAAVALADINEDGNLDILAAPFGGTGLQWFENSQESGAFIPHTVPGPFAGAIDVETADLDGDGRIDLIGAFFKGNQLAWFEKDDGSGAFIAHSIDSEIMGPRDIMPADLDNDGDIDVAAASDLDHSIRWYENRASGLFVPLLVSGSFPGASSVFVSDLDADGDFDLVATSLDDSSIAWFRNDGAGEFTEVVLFSPSASPANASTSAATPQDGESPNPGGTDVSRAAFAFGIPDAFLADSVEELPRMPWLHFTEHADGIATHLEYFQRSGGHGEIGLDYSYEGIRYLVEISDDNGESFSPPGRERIQESRIMKRNNDGTEIVRVSVRQAEGKNSPSLLRLIIKDEDR